VTVGADACRVRFGYWVDRFWRRSGCHPPRTGADQAHRGRAATVRAPCNVRSTAIRSQSRGRIGMTVRMVPATAETIAIAVGIAGFVRAVNAVQTKRPDPASRPRAPPAGRGHRSDA